MLKKSLSLLLLFAPGILAQANLGSTTLINSFETPQDLKMLSTTAATFTQVTTDVTAGQYAVQVTYQPATPPAKFSFLNFTAQSASLPPWNWSGLGGLAFDACNPGTDPVTIALVMGDQTPLNGGDKSNVEDWSATLNAGTCGTVLALFGNLPTPLSMGMQTAPPLPGFILMQYQDGTVDFSQIHQFDFYIASPAAPVTLIFDNVRVFTANIGSQLYTGIVDAFGQFTGASWPGKVSSASDLQAQAQAESALPFPASGSLDQYGGSLALPAVASTGYFRTTQDAAGKWWLVTPLGHLFFATGVDKVPWITTPSTTGDKSSDTQGREQMFTFLPAAADPLAALDTPAGHYPPPANLAIQNSLGTGYDFYSANLYRKYGTTYLASWEKSTIDRFTRWGINEIGSFSTPVIYPATGSLGQKIPHVVTLSYSACAGAACGNFAHVNSSQEIWGPIPDPFDPAFAATVDSNFAQQIPPYVNDAYVIGYYADSELSWAGGVNDPADSNHFNLIYGVLNSGSSQPAKQAFVQMLTSEYTDVGKLNQAWLTNFASWNDLLATAYAAPVPLPTAAMRADFSTFLLTYAQQYYRTISSTIRKYDPHHLYLGSKLFTFGIEVWQACAQLCDVVSFDDYNLRLDPVTWGFMSQFSKPAILAEFSFGATDRGVFMGHALVSSQSARALFYGLKIQDVATNPNLVGGTWYEYVDEPITGELSDGENFDYGLVPMTDIPYPELTNAATVVNGVAATWRMLPGAGQSAAPVVKAISPASVAVGSPDTILTVTGSGFAMNSVVQWGEYSLQTLYISGTQLWALVPAAYLDGAAGAAVTVSTPAPGGGTSNAVVFTAGNAPLITGVANAAGGQPGVVSGGFVAIYGSNFTSLAYDDWSNSITNGALPTALDGVRVMIGGKPAFVNAITPGQINVQAPDLSAGPVQVVVANPNGTSAAFSTTAALDSPAFFPWPANQPVATHLDYTWAVSNGTFSGTTTVATKPGEVIILWGMGFGPTNPPVPAGQEPTVQAPPTQTPVTVTLGGVSVPVLGAVLSTYAATYQIAIQVPASMANGSYPLVASVNGVQSPGNVLLTVQN